MKRGSRDLVAFLDEEVLPYLSTEALYQDVRFTKTQGRYWRGPCPFHGGTDSNFSVDTVTKGWTCWSHCGSGSAVAYINGGTTPHGRDFVEAIKKLAGLAGVSFPELERTDAEVKRAEERDRREALLLAFLAGVQAALRGEGGEDARAYLKDRGLSGSVLEDLGLYTTRDEVLAALLSKGFTKDEVTASGVVHDGRWEGRLIIPWRDRWGRLGTFAARDLAGKTDTGEKYLYLTTEKGWGKPKTDLVAFGLDRALQKRPDSLVLVEGLLDVVNLQAHGFLNVAAVGGGGREIRPERWEALAAFGVFSVALVLDNDPPGLEGTLAAVDNVRKVQNVRNVPVLYVVDPSHLGDYKDPDELARKRGVEAFRAVLDKKEPAAVFVGRQYLKNVTPESPTHEKEKAAGELAAYAGTLRGERSALYVEDLLRLAAERTGYSFEALADVTKRHEERRRQEEREREFDAALRKAATERARGADPVDVAQGLMETVSSVRAKALDEPLPFSVDRLERESKETAAGKSSGWKALDDQFIFFNPGELALLAARPGHCKTSALVGVLLNWARDAEKIGSDEVLVFYSQEELEVQIYHRLLALLAASTGGEWSPAEVKAYLAGGWGSRGGDYTWPSLGGLDKARETLRKWERRFLVVRRSAWTVENIVDHARNYSAHHNVGAVLVDYLQRILPGGAFERRDIELSTVTRRLKDLSMDINVPVIVGAQINREVIPKDYCETIGSKENYEAAKVEIKKARPALHNLREGGSEQEADLVLGLLSYGADFTTDAEGERTRQAPDVTLLEVGALKNRYGVPGRWARLAFEGKPMLVRDPDPEETL